MTEEIRDQQELPTSDSPKAISFIDELVEERRRQKSGGSGFILGAPGSGKSTAVELQIESILRSSEDDVFILDLEGQYLSLAKRLGGQVIRLDPAGYLHINPFDIYMIDEDEDSTIAAKSEFIIAMCESLIGGRYGLSPAQKSLVDRCVNQIYAPFLNFKDAETNAYDACLLPTMRDLYRTLRIKNNSFDAKCLADSLQLYASGSIDLFAGPTNFRKTKRFVIYDLRDFGLTFRTTGLLTVLEHVWTRYVVPQSKYRNGTYSWIFIDDIYSMSSNESASHYFACLSKRARCYSCILTGVTNYADSLFTKEFAQSLLTNCEYIHMLKLPPVVRETAAQMLNLPLEFIPSIGEYEVGLATIYETGRIALCSDSYAKIKRYCFDLEKDGWVEEQAQTANERGCS